MSAKRHVVLILDGNGLELHSRYRDPKVKDSRKDAQRLATQEVQSGKVPMAQVVECQQDITLTN